ncbi:MAG: hypothetical protein Q9167_001295 [Letrouitia subvulpina]
MSNQLVGSVYSRILDETVETCAVTFEEEGLSPNVLEEFKKTWQSRLTKFGCASFPWDPPPVPQPMVNPTPVPSNGPRQPQASSVGSPSLTSPTNSNPRIKTEPPHGNHGLQNGIQPNYGNSIAQQRAAQQLQERFGPNANVQINQLQAQVAMSNSGQQQQSPQNIQLPHQLSEQQKKEFERQRLQRQMQQLQQAQQRPAVSNAHTDGASDWDQMLALRRAAALENPAAIYDADITMQQQVEEMSQAMEGGGLMLPLSENPKYSQSKKRRISATNQLSMRMPFRMPSPQNISFSQSDGPSDLEGSKIEIKNEADLDNDEKGVDADEDAINSDLDDPDEEIVEEVGEDMGKGQMMVCTYDKVQRVKNKWKCVLKDGVLTTGGKE